MEMTRKKEHEVSLPTKNQVETERKRYRRQKAYNKALRGTVHVLTIVAAVAVLIATLVLPVLQIKKVWNTDASTEAADHVTVQLLQNYTVIRTAVLNADNNWQVTYTDMPESDAYCIAEINVPQGFTATYSQTGYVFTVTNTSTLIQTGQLVWPIPVLAAGGMLLIAVGTALLQKKRKTNA